MVRGVIWSPGTRCDCPCAERPAKAKAKPCQSQNQMGVYDVIVCDPPYGMRAPRIEGASGEKDPVVAGPRAMEAATMDFIRPVVAFAGSSCGLVSFSLF